MIERSQDDALARVRELDEALERRGVSSEASERVRAALEQRALERRFHARLRWWPALAFAAGAAVMAAALLYGGRRSIAPRPEPTPTIVEQINSPAPSCAPLEANKAATLAAGECAYGDGVRLSALSSSRYEWAPDRVELRAGELLFEVEARPDRPLAVELGAVSITVIGTRFVVHEEPDIGWISMLEGHVQVRIGEQEAEDLRAGQRRSWTNSAVVAPSFDEPAVAPDPTPAPEPTAKHDELDEGLAELLAEVAALRRAGEYAAAVDRLRAGERSRWTPRTQQLLSYEIGTLLERQLGELDAACEHWQDHRQRYPSGRHDAIIGRSMTRIGCDDR